MRFSAIGLIFSVALCLWGSATDDRVEQIDREVKELNEMKRGYESRALRAEDQADRLQFEDHFTIETRRFYQIAELNREKAAKIQEEIDRLENEKAQLLKKRKKENPSET